MATDGGDITLKMDVDIKDAKGAIDSFTKSTEKAFKSSDTKVQSLGNSLNKVNNHLQKSVNEMQKMQTTRVPTEEFKQLERDVSKAENAFIRAKKQLDNFSPSKKFAPTDEYNRLNETLNSTGSRIKEIQRTMKTDYGKSAWTDTFAGVEKQVASLQRKYQQAQAEVYKFTSKGIYTGQPYRDAQAELNKYKLALSDAQNAQYKLIQSGQQFKDQAGYNQLNNELAQLKQQYTQADTELQKLTQDGNAYRLSDAYRTKEEEVARLADRYNNLAEAKDKAEAQGTDTITVAEADTGKFEQLKQRITDCVNRGVLLNNQINNVNNTSKGLSSTWATIKNGIASVTKRIRGLGNDTKNTANLHNKSFKSMLRNVLKWGFGIRSVFLLYRKFRAVIKEGLTSMAQEFQDVADDVYMLKNSWSGFKASLVSAFQPIFSYVVPALSTMINYLTSAMNAVANFFALLTGQGFYYKAKKGISGVNNAIGGTGGAAKEANEELAEYDELLVIDQDKGGGGGGGAGAGADSDEWQWEKVETHSNALADALQDMWDVFKKAWETKGQDVINAATYAMESLKTAVTTVAKTIYQVFIDGYGETWLVSVLGVLEQILLIIGDIGTAFTEAWTKDNNGYKLVASFFTMLTSINDMCIKIGESWRTAWNSGLGESIIEHVLHIITNIQDTVTALSDKFREAWEANGNGVAIMTTILGIVDDIAEFFDNITESTKKWAEQLNLEPLVTKISDALKSVRGVIDEVLGIVKSLYEKYILPIIQHIVESTLPDILDNIKDALDNIKTILSKIDWDKIFETLEKITELALDSFMETLKTQTDDAKDSLGAIADVIDSSLQTWKDFKDILEDITGLDLNIKLDSKTSSGLTTFLKNVAKYGNPATASLEALKDGLKFLADTMKKLGDYIDEHKDDLAQLGKDIVNGIVEGFDSFLSSTNPFYNFFKWVVDNVKEVFGIHSPAKKMKEYGKYILLGIIEGFTEAFTNIGQAITDLKDKIVANISEKFTNFKDTIKEKIGELDVRNILGITEDNSVIDMVVNIGSEFTGKLKSIADFESLKEEWGEFADAYKDKSAKIKTTLSGIWEKVTDIDGTKDKLVNLWEQYQDKKADLKTTLSGKITEVFGIDDLRTRFTNLTDRWKDKKATLSSYIGGAISKITDLDTWKTKFTNMYNNWRGKTATMSSKVGGAISRITDLDTWTNKANTLYYYWRSKTADFKTKFDTTKGALDTWTDKMATLYANWRSKSATFSLSFSAAAGDLRSWVNTNVISKINSVFGRVPILKHHKVPYLARGGIVDSATMFVAGESGQEAVVPLEKNLGWLDKMATMISDKLADTQIPLIAQGNILPVSQAFMNTASTIVDNSNITTLLESILTRLNALETDSSNREPIMLQLDGRTVAQVVWDENEKRYKQTGMKYAY